MRLLIAEDDATSRLYLLKILENWGFEVEDTRDGEEAWAAIQRSDCPRIAILDWMMPGRDGPELCRNARDLPHGDSFYFILLTALDRKENIVQGLDAGADDYLAKPYDKDELRSRIRVGERILNLQSALSDRVEELEEALAEVKTLQGIIPICMHCHRIRNTAEAWERMEKYVENRSDAQFSHSLCPECLEKHYPKEAGDD